MGRGIGRGLALVALGLVLLASARADIAPARQYGTTLAPWGASGIRMTGEVVRIRLERERAHFHALFQLRNDTGERVTLDVGFPDAVQAGTWSSDVSEPPSRGGLVLGDFAVTVDGGAVETAPRYFQKEVGPLVRTELADSYRRREREIAAAADPAEKARLQAALDRDRESFGWWSSSGWAVWPMTFEPGATREVEVRYHLPYRGPYRHQLLGFHAVEYVLKSGAFWEGPIGQVVVEIELGEGITHDHLERLTPNAFERTAQGFRFEATDLEPEADVEIVLRDFVDARDAVRGYLAWAEEARAEHGDGADMWALCAAWEAAAQLDPAPVEIDVARRIAAYERATVESGLAAKEDATFFEVHPKIRRDVRAAYVPWEWRLVKSLERNGRTEEARAAAEEALPVLKRWLDDHRGRNIHWGRVEVPLLERAISRCEQLVAGE